MVYELRHLGVGSVSTREDGTSLGIPVPFHDPFRHRYQRSLKRIDNHQRVLLAFGNTL